MKLAVDGAHVEVDDRHAKTPLLWVLRDIIGLHGTKFGRRRTVGSLPQPASADVGL
jgi:aerobic-type carbon monoxide dehydrogenase small subunit (CoxS/CutS family)